MGLMHSVTGLLAFAASAAAGWLWAKVHPSAPFFYGAVCALVSAVALGCWRPGPSPVAPNRKIGKAEADAIP